MKILKGILCVMLVSALLFSAALAEETLAGAYLLDATPLGMPITVYLIIDENGSFQLTNKLEGGADKGSGQIGSQDGLYLMLYSDSTNDQVKSATFTVEGGKLIFSTRVPYGAAGLSPNTEDPDNVIWPVAKKIAYEEWLGVYVGSLEVNAMGSAIVYDVTLTLDLGMEYTLVSTFAMGGETYDYTQTGSFSVDGGQITLDAMEGQVGSIDENGIVIPAFLSQMASSPREITLEKAVTAAVAGNYVGVKDMSMMGFSVNVSLALDAVGGYVYTARIDGEEDYVMTGAFTYDSGALILTSEGQDPVEATLENEVISASLPISAAMPRATALTFYSEAVLGTFTGAADGEDGSKYESTLTLNPDGTYQIAVKKDGADAYQEAGAFTLETSMTGLTLVLTAADGTVSTGMVDATINVNHNIDAAYNTLGFKYTK